MEEIIKKNILDSIETKRKVLENLLPEINEVTQEFVETYKLGKKVILCGNGGSFSDVLHFQGELVGRYKTERNPLSSVVLGSGIATMTAIANDYHYNDVFLRELKSIGAHGDLLAGFSTSGNSQNVINAIQYARENKIKTIGFLGKDGGKLRDLCDLSLIIPSSDTARIQEVHITLIHSICEVLDLHFTENE